ncbi:MAG: hypothetical protein M1297_09785 [Nitrospirae bacterium]|nr:hypothetical protein [Nitrospirota bacterium]
MRLDNVMNGKSYFGGPLDPEIASLLEDAAIHFSDTKKALSSLLEAREMAPYALAVFFSLYKFYFYLFSSFGAHWKPRTAGRGGMRSPFCLSVLNPVVNFSVNIRSSR